MYKHVLQVGTSRTKKLMKQLTLWLLYFSLFISNSGDDDQTQMGNRKANEMESGYRCYERVAKVAKHQATNAAYHEVNAIGR